MFFLFCRNVFAGIVKLIKINIHIFKPKKFKFQANGLVERNNRTVQNLLLRTLSDRHENWDNCLHGVLFALRSTIQASTKFSPFKMLYGREPVLPIDVDHEFADCTSDPDDANDPEFDESDFQVTLSKLQMLQVIFIQK